MCADFFWNDKGAEVVCKQMGFPFESRWSVCVCVCVCASLCMDVCSCVRMCDYIK